APRSIEPAPVPPVRIAPSMSAAASKPRRPTRSSIADRGKRAPTTEPASTAAPRWLSPRLEQLGVLPRWRAAVIGLDDRRLLSELQQSVGELWIGRAARGEHDAIILGVADASGLAQLAMLEPSLKAGGVIWVLHPVHDPTMTKEAMAEAARDAHLNHLASTRLTPNSVAEKFVRPRHARVS